MAWRDRLVKGTFRGVPFDYEKIDRAGGRGTVVHNFPKANKHYTEDMGKRARGFDIDAYVIGPNYHIQRDALIAALEAEGPGSLVLPTGGGGRVIADNYNVQESRNEGGFAVFTIQFVEAGSPALSVPLVDTAMQAVSQAGAAVGAVVAAAKRLVRA